MKIVCYNDLDFYSPAKNLSCAVALGSFDGLHVAHMSIIEEAACVAKTRGLASVVHTFTRNPANIINDFNTSYISSNQQKAKLLEGIVDCLVMQEFNAELMNTPPDAFFRDGLIRGLNAKALVAGYNYRFGKGGSGDTNLLTALCKGAGVELSVVDPVTINGMPVSSSAIRKFIESGELDMARQYLGRYFSVHGMVERGDSIGHSLGFATANIMIPHGQVRLPYGVYRTRTEVCGKTYASVTNYGGKPTFDSGGERIETHIIGLSATLYGEMMEVYFIDKLRDIIKFDSIDQLAAQVHEDIRRASNG